MKKQQGETWWMRHTLSPELIAYFANKGLNPWLTVIEGREVAIDEVISRSGVYKVRGTLK